MGELIRIGECRRRAATLLDRTVHRTQLERWIRAGLPVSAGGDGRGWRMFRWHDVSRWLTDRRNEGRL